MLRDNSDVGNHNTSNGWSSGFLFGLLVGVALALLFTTKKGRRILKVLTDEGMHKLSQWEDLVEKLPENMDPEVREVEDEAEDTYLPIHEEIIKHNEEKTKTHSQTNGEIKKANSKRRLFRGIPKKS